ncbi:MAG: hypothetical protein IJ072_00285, partial [Oscillospiraceae bacterium]|nr:hypothetical protein [Oscillospiraceae bacterium]
VYNGGIYTQSESYWGADAHPIDALVGEYLGYATGSIDEWSDPSEYEQEFAGSIYGDLYAVKGYDTDFRICVRPEIQPEDDEPYLWIEFLDRLNDINLVTGADLFETRLHLRDRVESVQWQSHDDWNYNTGNIQDVELGELWDAFLDAVDTGEFVNTWNPNNSVSDPFYEGKEHTSIYDTPNQAHLILSMDDGTTVRMRLIEGGYVGYDALGWYFVKIPGEAFDAVYDACGGTHVDGWEFVGR